MSDLEPNEESKKFLPVPDETKDPREDDVIVRTVGALGRWQILVSLAACLVKFPVAWIQLSIVFLSPPVTFSCESSPNSTDECIENCTGYDYDRPIFTETIATEWDLICDRAYLANLVQTVTMLGILAGNMLFGYFADRFGRRNPLIAAVALQILCGIGAAFAQNFYLFLVLRFFAAWATGGTMITSFVLVMEIVGAKWRTPFGIIYQVPFSLGHLTLPLFAYFLRDWRHLHVAICTPSILLLSYYWFLPESPRWLLTVGKNEQAIEILERGARHNGLPADKIKEEVDLHLLKGEKEGKQLNSEGGGNILDLVRTPIMRTYTAFLGFNWFASGLCFFGGAQYIGQLGGNIFINVALSAIIQVPGILFSVWSLHAWGRKYSLIFANLVAAISCLLIGLVPPEPAWIRSGLSSVAMFGMAMSFPTAYIYSGELFPTTIRNVGVGTGSTFARVGSMVAPFIGALAGVREWLPMMIFGIVPMIGALMCLGLPETLNCKLPDTVEEAERLSKKEETVIKTVTNLTLKEM